MEGSANRGVLLDFVTYTADLDGAFRDHLEKYNEVQNLLKSIQIDLLSCMLKVYTEEITREIKILGTCLCRQMKLLIFHANLNL